MGVACVVLAVWSCTNPLLKGSGQEVSGQRGEPTYTTTVSGKISTFQGDLIATARVWASTDPTTKVTVGADGSYTLAVTHPGTFSIIAEYTARDGNYYSSYPRVIMTTKAVYSLVLSLSHKSTFRLFGRVYSRSSGNLVSGALIQVFINGREVKRTTSLNVPGYMGTYNIYFNNPGTFTVKASFGSQSVTQKVENVTSRLWPLILYL